MWCRGVVWCRRSCVVYRGSCVELRHDAGGVVQGVWCGRSGVGAGVWCSGSGVEAMV